MTSVNDYIFLFSDHRIEIGEGLISYNDKKESYVMNFMGSKILELNKNEYCLNCNNYYFLVIDSDDKQRFNIIDSNKNLIKTIKTEYLIISDLKNYYVYSNDEGINFIDYKGELKRIFSRNEGNYGFNGIKQLSNNIFSIIYTADLENQRSKYVSSKSTHIVLNIETNNIIIQGQSIYNQWRGYYDTIIIDSVEIFSILLNINHKKYDWQTELQVQSFCLDVIKYVKIDLTEDVDSPVYTTVFSDFNGNVVKEFNYSDIIKDNNYFITKRHLNGNHLYGVLDSDLATILPCRFPELNTENECIIIKQHEWDECKSCVLDLCTKRFMLTFKDGTHILLPYLYFTYDKDSIVGTHDAHYAKKYGEDGTIQIGIISHLGDILIDAEFDRIQALTDRLLEAVYANNKKINSSIVLLSITENSIKIQNHYRTVEPDSFGMSDFFRVRLISDDKHKALFGLVDRNGKEIIPPEYDYIEFPLFNKSTFIKDGKAGWISLTDMSEHIYPKYSQIKSFYNNCAIVSIGELSIRCLSDDRYESGWDEACDCPMYSPCKTEDIYCGIPTISYKYRKHKEGVISSVGEIIIDAIYEEIKYFNNSFIVCKNGLWGMANHDGKIIVPIEFDGYDVESEYFDNDSTKDASIVFHDFNRANLYFYNSDGSLIHSESSKDFWRRHPSDDDYDHTDNYDYDRDTFYALGGDDYVRFKDNGGNIDEMMDGMGY